MFFLDTNICVYYLKGKYSSIADHFRKIPCNEIKIPIIVKAELLFGIEKSEQKEYNKKVFENFIKPFEVINLNNDVLNYYA